MKSFPLVSVIVPCYNHEEYIEVCIQSILCQTYQNVQLIVVDDGSTDSSFEYIERLGKQYQFIYEKRTNHGLSATLNYAIRNYAKGKYICIVASDDYWPVNKVEAQVQYMEDFPDVAMSFGKAQSFESNEKMLDIWPNDIQAHSLSFKALLEENVIPAPTVMFKRDIFLDLGGYDEALLIEDLDLWLRFSKRYKIAYIDQVLAYYRRHATNLSKDIERMYRSKYQILQKYADESGHEERLKQWAYERLRAFAETDKSTAIKELFRTNSLLRWYHLDFYKIIGHILFKKILT